jgi:phosphatidate cytidylyltransferase
VSSLSNLSQRLLTAAVLVSVLLLALFYAPPLLWAGFVLVFMAVGAHEWAGLSKFSSGAALTYAAATVLFGLLGYFMALADSALVYLPALLFWVFVAPLWLTRAWPAAQGIAALLLGWLLLLPTFLALVYLREQGALVLLLALSIAIVADSAAYFAGRAFGRHKLAPSISPGKTREGAAGGALAIAVYGFFLATPEGPGLPIVLAAFLFLFVLSVLGDLFESWIKRQAGVKDSGRLLPGHGGVLDRIDSQLAVLPVAALIWILLK